MALSGWDQMIGRFLSPETIHTRGYLNQTLLHYVVLRNCNNLAMMKLLISHGIEVNAGTGTQGYQASYTEEDLYVSALHYLAASEYHWQVEGLAYLYRMGGDLNVVNDSRETCLHVAILRGGYYKREMIATLLEIGADVRALTRAGEMVLSIAVGSGDIEMVRMLLDHGMEIEEGEQNPLYDAIKLRNINMIKFLIEKGARVDSKPFSLMGLGKSFDWKYGEYLYKSILADALGGLNLKTPADAGMVQEIFNLLLQHSADINEKGCYEVSLIHWLAWSHGFLDLIIKAGADIERLDGKGRTPLIVACGSPNSAGSEWTGRRHTARSRC